MDEVKVPLPLNPLPADIDPFTGTLLGGVDPVARHQTVTVLVPILSYLGQNARVLYTDGTLRWISGQSWQTGVSGCGKSLVLSTLEELFLSKELRENEVNAQKAADYSLLSDKERDEKPLPKEKVHVMNNIPTAIALLQQTQINGGGVIYISCSECGEFGKKIGGPYYSIVLDMLKKSYDGTGEPFMHKTKDTMYYTPSMKLCVNVGGTLDQMFRILRYCNADGTLSRGNLIIMTSRKDEKTYGAYRAPDWTPEERSFLRECADRLRMFNNKFHENEKLNEIDECNALLEKYGFRGEGVLVPTVQDLEDCVQRERCARAVCIPEVLELGRDIKAYLSRLGDVASDCCSRADERAMGLTYLLLIANGFAPLRSGGGRADDSGEARTPEDSLLLKQCISVARWWIMTTIDCAIAVQTRIDMRYRSERNGILTAYGETVGRRVNDEVRLARERAFEEFEAKYAGKDVSVSDLKSWDLFSDLGQTTLYHLVAERRWRAVGRGRYRMPARKEEGS